MHNSQASLAAALFSDGYAFGTVDQTPLAGLIRTAAWSTFAESYANLVQDTYMADGGTYRNRRYTEFICNSKSPDIAILPHRGYEQSKEINKLNGGVSRIFSPFEENVANGHVIRDLLLWATRMIADHTGLSTWTVQCFQNQTLARTGQVGQPTPEGVHRDGVEIVLTLLVQRYNVAGGVSSVYMNNDLEHPALQVELSEPGQLLLNDDTRTLHGVSAIFPKTGSFGYRNIFNALFISNA